ncbi:transposase [Streptomyces sp. NPDC091294]|uniref:transposase n=1 Tax=Streptomyces sp. NPDC091294 TaxID=3365992 RepID=UPI0037FD5AD0
MLEPLLPRSNNRCGRRRDHRQVINGNIHRLSTGGQWRQLPARFGPWQTIHERHRLWSADATWERLLQHPPAIADEAGDIDWNINVDSPSIRAHQHAAGAVIRRSAWTVHPNRLCTLRVEQPRTCKPLTT